MPHKNNILIIDDPLWYKDAIIYEVPIKAFKDGNTDGIGDFKGLSSKLDYLEDLGVTALWILPFYPSPNKDGGYDISDYFNVNSDYGTIKDFKDFLNEAHARGIRVITELVINHTSDQHAWFKRSRTSPKNSNYRNFYVWSDTQNKYKDARIIFKDFETSNWTNDPVANQYYWHRFYSHQPDLNFENTNVKKAVLKALDFWLDMGVDGLRLDAIPYLFEEEGTNCENLEKTHKFIKEVRTHVDKYHKNKMLLAEANQWPEDSAKYFGNADECHMAFHFPLMPRMYMALEMENAFPLIDIMEQTPSIDEKCQWANFLRNHDELTLEMVTDEERDFMYRAFADEPRAKINLGIRRRLAPLLKNNRRKIELLNILLFSITGTPVLYYGDEIGMGDNIYLGDRDGVRTPMQWNGDKNSGFSDANPQKLYLPLIIDPEYHHSVINVENQERNSSSLLWWMKRTIDIRKKFKAFGRGSLKFIDNENKKVLVYIREYENEKILVAVNLSKWAQAVKLNLNEYESYTPIELFSGNEFPKIEANSYTITFGPYEYYWFILEKKEENISTYIAPSLTLISNFKSLFTRETLKFSLAQTLLKYLKKSNYLVKYSKSINGLEIVDAIEIESNKSYLLILNLELTDNENKLIQLPLSLLDDEKDDICFKLNLKEDCIIARTKVENKNAILINSIYDSSFRLNLINFLLKKKNIKSNNYTYNINLSKKINFIELDSTIKHENEFYYLIKFGSDYILKLYKKLELQITNDYEYRFNINKCKKDICLEHLASFFIKDKNKNSLSFILMNNIEDIGSAKEYLNESLDKYLDYVLSNKDYKNADFVEKKLKLTDKPVDANEVFSSLEVFNIDLIAKLMSDFSSCLFEKDKIANFMYQRSIYQNFISLSKKMFIQLNNKIKEYEDNLIFDIYDLNSKKNDLLKIPSFLINKKCDFNLIKVHGYLRSDKILFTGKDFFIKDFDGDMNKPISERKLEKDLSFDLATLAASIIIDTYEKLYFSEKIRNLDINILKPWVDNWLLNVLSVLNSSYLNYLKANKILTDNFDSSNMNELYFTYLIEELISYIIININDKNNLTIGLKSLINILNLKYS